MYVPILSKRLVRSAEEDSSSFQKVVCIQRGVCVLTEGKKSFSLLVMCYKMDGLQ